MDENIKSEIAYTNALNSGLMGLSEMTNPLLNIQKPTVQTQLTISDLKKAELQKLAEKDLRKRNRRAYWNISKEERSEITSNLLLAGIATIPSLMAGVLDNDYSNALASFTTGETNPIVDVIGNTHKMLESMNLNKQSIPGLGIKSGESLFAKQGMKIEYMNLFK